MIEVNANLGDLSDVDLTTKLPSNNDSLTYDSKSSKWIPVPVGAGVVSSGPGSTYTIELDRWKINNDGTHSAGTTKGINDALGWAKAQGYNHVFLKNGTYALQADPSTLNCIVLYSNFHFEMENGCVLKLDANSSPYYNIFLLKGLSNTKLTGGKIIGDRPSHIYQIGVKFVRGGVNPDGSLNDDPNFIRSETIDRYANPGLLSKFRLWSIDGVTASGYNFYQYKDTVSSSTFVNYRNNGLFAPSAPTGRGWFDVIDKANKMVFTINIASSPLTDEQLAQINAKVDNESWTHEWGEGISISGSNYVEISDVEICDCTGDAIITTILDHREDPSLYTQEEMGSHIYIHDCDLHNCRRQGISLAGSNDTYIYNNNIHNIGQADDGTVDGTQPMFGIDIESMWSETNIPTWRPELNQIGFELNTRIYVYNNYIHSNQNGHFVNADGINVTIEGNTFEGWNVGGITSYSANWYVKYLNNTFISTELMVQGDNFVNGADCRGANIKLFDISGAYIQNCHIQNGTFYGYEANGYFGTPAKVDVPSGVFTYTAPHGMGNGAKVCFEQWVGTVPTGISVDKLYYTVNVTSTSFQVAENKSGTPVAINDAGVGGFNISRYNYGRVYISDIVVERDWLDSTTTGETRFNLTLSGGVVKNVTAKNADMTVVAVENYVGRPNTLDGITVIEDTAIFGACILTNGTFIRTKTKAMGGDVYFGQNNPLFSRKVIASNCMFQNVQVRFEGNATNNNSTYLNCLIDKSDNNYSSALTSSYLEDTSIGFHWLTQPNSMTIAKCVFKNVTTATNASTLMIDNTTI
ncbi:MULTISPECIES: right-handed parallel beta-helix repeat-containing protein [unclassified Paenibacillus]|uniref:right-handed parallel beta-helix repeat-containing protein n=1 Tax=unclassified Paenibacillus TaxID=185978 RepID=UPI00363CEF85